jgi:hypothetical protein
MSQHGPLPRPRQLPLVPNIPAFSNLAALATTTVQSSGVPQLQARMAASGALIRILLFWAMLGCGICISANNPPSFGLNNLFNKITAPTTSEKDRDQLYEAYNMLHTLAQDFNKPFDAPAVIVVGHQTSGKSALIEALMGFQFNQVGPSRCPQRLWFNLLMTRPPLLFVGWWGNENAPSNCAENAVQR